MMVNENKSSKKTKIEKETNRMTPSRIKSSESGSLAVMMATMACCMFTRKATSERALARNLSRKSVEVRRKGLLFHDEKKMSKTYCV